MFLQEYEKLKVLDKYRSIMWRGMDIPDLL